MDVFNKYPWPGNVRELENVLEGIITIYDCERVNLEHLPSQYEEYIYEKGDISNIKSLKKTIEEVEKDIISEALRSTDYNITKTAELIDIPRQTLQYKIKKYELK